VRAGSNWSLLVAIELDGQNDYKDEIVRCSKNPVRQGLQQHFKIPKTVIKQIFK
jgi:hypothetical protein